MFCNEGKAGAVKHIKAIGLLLFLVAFLVPELGDVHLMSVFILFLVRSRLLSGHLLLKTFSLNYHYVIFAF